MLFLGDKRKAFTVSNVAPLTLLYGCAFKGDSFDVVSTLKCHFFSFFFSRK